MADRIVLTGGTGFVGGHLRRALNGRPLRLLVRDPTRNASLAAPDVEVVAGEVTRPESLRGTMEGCGTLIHLVAIIEERGEATFDRVILGGTANVVAEAERSGVGQIIYVSALGARDEPRYPYLAAKWRAERAVIGSGIPWAIFRPSVVFGPGDGFITVLAGLVRRAPILPVVGDGRSAFMPVAIGEVAEAIVRVLDDPSLRGEIYEIGGARVYTYEEMLDLIAARLGKRRRKLHLPVGLMRGIVALTRPMPRALRPPVTSEQLAMLALDNTTADNALPRLIGRAPLALEDGLDYIARR